MSDHFEGRPRSDSTDIALRKIFIGGLSYSTDEEKLRKYFRTYGAVQDAVVMKDPVSKRSRGFGFITFYDINAVDNVLANEPHTIDARKVEAKRAVPRAEMGIKEVAGTTLAKPVPSTPQSGLKAPTPQSSPQLTPMKSGNSPGDSGEKSNDPKLEEYAYNKIFVGGLHYDTRDPDFRNYFERFGKVISAEVMFNRETHKSRGFGFIVFELEDTAIRVCMEKEHIIDGKVVEVKRAIPRSKIVSSNSSSQLNALSPPHTTTSAFSHTTPAKSSSPSDYSTPNHSTGGDVRARALSAGAISFMGTPSVTPSMTTNNNSLHQQNISSPGVLSLKPPLVNVSGSQLPPSGARKAPTPTSHLSSSSNNNNNNNHPLNQKPSGSYATALKLGGSLEEQQLQQQQQRDFLMNSSNLGSGIDSFSMNINNNTSSSNLQSLLRSTSRELDVRQSRALSEPIKFDNSFAFSQDMFDLNSIRFGNTAPTPSGGGIGSALSADNIPPMQESSRYFSSPPKGNGGFGSGSSFSWLGGSPTSNNKFDSILDPNQPPQSLQSQSGGIASEFTTRNRAHSLGPTTIASVPSRSPPGFLVGYPSYGSYSNENFLSENVNVSRSPAIDRQQYQLGYGLQQYPSNASLDNTGKTFMTPSRSQSGVIGGELPPSGLSKQQKSPAPTAEWTNLLHQTGSGNRSLSSDNSNSLTGGLLGILGEGSAAVGGGAGLRGFGEGTSLLHEGGGVGGGAIPIGMLSSDTSGSRILSISRSDSNDILPQRRHSHPLPHPNPDVFYDASRLGDMNSPPGLDWSRR